jgi:hypothetical protein
LIKKTSVDTSILVRPPVHQKKSTGTSSGSRKTDPTDEDFEMVEHDEHGELDEEFDVMDNQGPSAASGALYTGWEDYE